MSARSQAPHADDSTRVTSIAVWQALGRLAGSAKIHLQVTELMGRQGQPLRATDSLPPNK